MSSEKSAELVDLVREWLRIDQVCGQVAKVMVQH